jgi:hypothetical protein
MMSGGTGLSIDGSCNDIDATLFNGTLSSTAVSDSGTGTLTIPTSFDDDEITAAASATNYTPSAATVAGHLSGIDTELGTISGGGGATAIDDLTDVDTDKSKTPADGDVLTFDGTDWNAETPSGGGGGGTPQAVVSYPITADSMPFVLEGASSANITLTPPTTSSNYMEITVDSGTSNTAAVHVNNDALGMNNNIDIWDRNPKLYFRAKIVPSTSNWNNFYIGLGFSNGADFDYADDNAGFLWQRGSSSYVIAMVSNNNTSSYSQQTTLGTAVKDSNWHDYAIVVRSDDGEIDYYQDGVLLGTRTTYIPTGTNATGDGGFVSIGMQNTTSTGSPILQFAAFTLSYDMF